MSAGGKGSDALPGIHFSDAYSKLVIDDNDLIGHLAYSFYKKQKRELIVSQGLKRDDYRILNYHHDLQVVRVATLRSYAEGRLNDYADKVAAQIMEDERKKARSDEIVNIMLQEYRSKKDEIIRHIKNGTSSWKSVFIGVVSSFVFGVILTAASLIQWTNPMNVFTDGKIKAQVTDYVR